MIEHYANIIRVEIMALDAANIATDLADRRRYIAIVEAASVLAKKMLAACNDADRRECNETAMRMVELHRTGRKAS